MRSRSPPRWAGMSSSPPRTRRMVAWRWRPTRRARRSSSSGRTLRPANDRNHRDTARMDLMIEAEGLTKHFGDVEALAGLDLAVPSGQVLAILGPNGAGKTTF